MYNCSSTADGGLEDGKRVAIVGGLGDGSSHDGVPWFALRVLQNDTGMRLEWHQINPVRAVKATV